MTVKSTARVLVTRKGRKIVTHLETIDEVVDMWRERYDRIFANECKSRRTWAGLSVKKSSPDVEARIAERQVEWDEYVRDQLADLATAKEK